MGSGMQGKGCQETLSGLAPLMNAVGYAYAAVGATGEEKPGVGGEHLLHGVNARQMPHQILWIGPLPAKHPRQAGSRGDAEHFLELLRDQANQRRVVKSQQRFVAYPADEATN